MSNVKLNKAVEKLWDLETLGIQENEVLVYEKFFDKVEFKIEWYEVFLEDNFALSEKNQKLL